MAAGLLLAVGVLAAFWPRHYGREALLADIGEQRTTLARIVGQPYGPEPETWRSGTDARIPPIVLEAGGRALRAATAIEDSRAALDAGAAWLLIGDTDRAITELTFALDGAPRDQQAEVVADLAAAYVERGRRQNRAADFAQALDLLMRLDPARERLPDEVYFNRALALEFLGLRGEAVEAWNAYLARDPDSPWANDARRYRAALGTPPQGRAPDGRLWLQDDALPTLARAVLARGVMGLPEVERGRALLAHPAASSLADADRAALEAWLGGATPQAARAMATQLTTFARMRILYEDEARTEASAALAPPMLDWRAPLFVRGWARLHLSLQAYGTGDLDGARLLAMRGVTDARASRDGALEGRLHRVLAVVAMRQMALGTARAAYLDALAALDGTDDDETRAATYASLGEIHELLNEPAQAWTWYQRAVSAAADLAPGRRRHGILAAAAWSCYRQRLFGLGAMLVDALVAHSDIWNAPLSRAEARVLAARLLGEAGHATRARTYADEAAAIIPTIAEPAYRERLSLLLRAARYVAGGVDGHPPELADAAGEDDLISPDVLIEAGKHAHARGRHDQAVLLAARATTMIGAAPAGPDGAASPGFGDFYADARRLRADALMARDPSGRALYAALEGADEEATAANARGMTAAAPARSDRLVIFEDGADTLYRLVVADGQVQASSVSVRTVETLRAQLRREIHEGARPSGAAERLGALLLGDVPSGSGAAAAPLVLVRSPRLHDVPFAMLEVGGRRLIDDTAFVFAAALSSPRLPSTATRAFLGLVPSGARGMALLAGADDEVQAAAAGYEQQAVHAIGDDGRWPPADVVHLVAHATVDPTTGVGAIVDDAAEGKDVVAAIRRTGAQLVVLSACATGAGRVYASGGTESVAGALIDAGVPAVVASLWPVPDGALVGFWRGFHEALRAGATPAEALRRTQRASARAGMSPRLWATFVVEVG